MFDFIYILTHIKNSAYCDGQPTETKTDIFVFESHFDADLSAKNLAKSIKHNNLSPSLGDINFDRIFYLNTHFNIIYLDRHKVQRAQINKKLDNLKNISLQQQEQNVNNHQNDNEITDFDHPNLPVGWNMQGKPILMKDLIKDPYDWDDTLSLDKILKLAHARIKRMAPNYYTDAHGINFSKYMALIELKNKTDSGGDIAKHIFNKIEYLRSELLNNSYSNSSSSEDDYYDNSED